MMKIKQSIACILLLVMAEIIPFTTFAEETAISAVGIGEAVSASEAHPPPQPEIDDPLPFTAELRKSAIEYGVYGRLSETSDDIAEIVPCYSLDGNSYMEEKYNKWIVDASDPDLNQQQCFWQTDIPLKKFLAKEIDKFYIKMKISYHNGQVRWTEPGCISRSLEIQPVPDDFLIEAWYDTPIRMIQFKPLKIWGAYHFTVSDTSTTKELAALLPQQIPVELQFTQNGQHLINKSVPYMAMWPTDISLDNEVVEVIATEITPPEEVNVSIGTDNYQMQNLEKIPFQGMELKAIFHRIPVGTPSSLKIRATEDGISATLPLKPTGATKIVPEYSTDGGEKWITLSNVLPNCPVESTLPKQECYTVPILESDAAPMKEYLNQTIAGFSVRLRIEGGALVGLTQTETWPAAYDYVPPRDDTNEDGGTGNNGNIGAGTGGSTDAGQRPGLSQEETQMSVPSSVSTAPAADVAFPVEAASTQPRVTLELIEPKVATEYDTTVHMPTPDRLQQIVQDHETSVHEQTKQPTEEQAVNIVDPAQTRFPERSATQTIIPGIVMIVVLFVGGAVAAVGAWMVEGSSGASGAFILRGKLKKLLIRASNTKRHSAVDEMNRFR
ncbi:MAG: hypothetical protein RR135_00455 [Oscillospiraceae bacterium]